MNKRQESILFWLVCFLMISLVCVVLGWSGMTGLTPPRPNILRQMQQRAVFMSFVLILSALILIWYFYRGRISKWIKIWSIPVVIATVIVLLLILPNENNLRLISCCGESSSSFWGFPYGWIECDGRNFCGLDGGKIDWSFASINFWVGINLMVCVIGLAENIYTGSRKIVALSQGIKNE
jgi:hypothetical protein